MDYNKLIELRAIVSTRINELLKENDFEMSIDYLKYIHGYLFKDILENTAGVIRNYNISKPEDILNGERVKFDDCHMIEIDLNYDMSDAKKLNWRWLSDEELLNKIAHFTSNIWNVHPFDNGNTRTVTVFISNFLHTLDFKVDNHIFKSNSRYFRDALVLSSYYNSKLDIEPDFEPLKTYFYKLLYDESLELDDDSLCVKKLFVPKKRILR